MGSISKSLAKRRVSLQSVVHRGKVLHKILVMVLLGVFCIALLLTLQNGDAQQASSDWPMFRGNPWHSGSGQGTPVTSPVLLWKFNASSSVASGPAIVDGIIYFGSENGTIFALNALSGAQIWNRTTPMSADTSPAVVDGVVYIGCNSPDNYPVGTAPPPPTGIVYALNAYNGEEIWNFSVDGWVASPTTVDGVVYFGTSNDDNTGIFYALQATNGSEIWDFSDGLGPVTGNPAVVDGVVYFCAFDGGVYALNASNGQEYWRTFTSGGRSSPAVTNGVVYVGSWLHQIYALDANGDIIWNYTTGSCVWSSPAYANGEIYIGSDDGHLYCLDANTGAKVWSFTSPIICKDIDSSPVFCNGVVYFTAYSNLFAVNASSGTQLWNYDIGGFLADAGEIAVDGGVVYVGSGDGCMYAFGDSANSPTSTPSATTVIATTASGATVDLAISGNITSSQMSNVTIATDQSDKTTTVSFTVTGESGTTGFGNITIPKSAVPYGTTPTVYINGTLASNQGYTQDSSNYYVWYTTQFSTHQISIVFTTTSSSTNPAVSPSLAQDVIFGVAVAVAIEITAAFVFEFKQARKTKTFAQAGEVG